MLRLPLDNSPICIFVQTVLKLMISLKRGHEIHDLTNKHHFSTLCIVAVQDILMQNDTVQRLSPQEFPGESLFKS